MRGKCQQCLLDGPKILGQLEDNDVVLLKVNVLILLALVAAASGEKQDLTARFLNDCRVEVVGSNLLRKRDFANLPVALFGQLGYVVLCVAH